MPTFAQKRPTVRLCVSTSIGLCRWSCAVCRDKGKSGRNKGVCEDSIYEKMPRFRGGDFSVFGNRADFKVFCNGSKGMVVIAGSCLCVKFIPQIHPFGFLQCPSADAEQIVDIAVSPDDFYLDVCLCHGVYLSLWGGFPPPFVFKSTRKFRCRP